MGRHKVNRYTHSYKAHVEKQPIEFFRGYYTDESIVIGDLESVTDEKIFEYHRTFKTPYKKRLCEENLEIAESDDPKVLEKHCIWPTPLETGYSLS